MKHILLVALFCLCAMPVQALDVTSLGMLPVQHEGRIKPLDTFARLYWQRFSESDHNATQKLAQALFDPAEALNARHLRITSPAVRAMLDLPERDDHLYSYAEVTPKLREHKDSFDALMQKDQNQFTATEQALWSLFQAVDDMTQITGAMSLFLPVDMPLSAKLSAKIQWPETAPHSYYGLSSGMAKLQQEVQQLAQEKGDDLSRYSTEQKQLALLSMRLSRIEATGDNNHLLRVIPSTIREEWASPWSVLRMGAGTPEAAPIMQQWQALTLAYHSDDQAAWDAAFNALHASLNPHVDDSILSLEQLYHQFDIVNVTLFSYLIVLALAVINQPLWALRFMGFALAQHVLMLGLRILILQRPPVSSLYESVLFVSFVAALCGTFIAAKSKSREGLLIGSGLAALLLSISGVYAGDQDPMAMPIAVLNTNFWLATHVIIITAGYGAALVAGTMAHVALIHAQAPAWRYLQGATLVALLLTTIGTILGGVWADQSWGRFWGWDPKENGALLIVLWLAWLLHARMTRYVSAAGFAALLGATNIIVALSWFGINLLNVGLHSYGFTSEAAVGLGAFCVAEIGILLMLYVRCKRRML